MCYSNLRYLLTIKQWAIYFCHKRKGVTCRCVFGRHYFLYPFSILLPFTFFQMRFLVLAFCLCLVAFAAATLKWDDTGKYRLIQTEDIKYPIYKYLPVSSSGLRHYKPIPIAIPIRYRALMPFHFDYKQL